MSPLTHHVSRSTWYLLAVIYTSMFAMMMATMLYAHIEADRSARRFCSVITTVDNSYRARPPTTDAGRVQADNFARLRRELHC